MCTYSLQHLSLQVLKFQNLLPLDFLFLSVNVLGRLFSWSIVHDSAKYFLDNLRPYEASLVSTPCGYMDLIWCVAESILIWCLYQNIMSLIL